MAPTLALLLSSVLGAGLIPPSAGTPSPGATWRVGASLALSGPTGDLGRSCELGLRAAFAEVNAQGGVFGRPLELIALDDGYEPARTAPNVRRLVDAEDVLVLAGCLGAPCAVAAVPIASESRTPVWAYVSGGAALRRSPPDPFVFNLRASLAQEIGALVDALVEGGRTAPEEIAFFTQLDSYGDSAFAGALVALRRHGIEDARTVLHARYERNTAAVELGLAEILLSARPIRAVILAAAREPAAAFIRQARRAGLDARLATVSFVDAARLARDLGAEGDGVVVSQVVPSPGSDTALARSFRAAMAHAPPGSVDSHISFETYTAARILVEAFQRSGAEPTRSSVTAALASLGRFDPGWGVELSLGPGDHEASDRVWLTVLRAGSVEPLSRGSTIEVR